MKVDQRLVQAAIDFTDQRFPGVPWEGAAAVYTEDGEILVSTALAALNDSVSLCHETGAYCEAYAKDKKVAASVCVTRDDQRRFVILTPCGVCQERLWLWGGQVEVAVPEEEDVTRWKSIPLEELNRHYWRKPFMGKSK